MIGWTVIAYLLPKQKGKTPNLSTGKVVCILDFPNNTLLGHILDNC